MRWMLLGMALALAGAGSLTAWRARTVWLWPPALVAGEYGHWLGLLPIAVMWASWQVGGGLKWMISGLCAAALAGFLKPSFQAWRMGGEVRAELARTFGPAGIRREPFAMRALAARTPDMPFREEAVPIAGGSEVLPLDFYPAAGQSGPVPCVVMIHGGGWQGGNRRQMTALHRHLASRGYSVAAVSYRFAPEHRWPAQADDIGAAIAWLNANADSLGIDPRQLVLVGRSAGGQLATAYAYGRRDPAVCGVVALYGPHDVEFAWKHSRKNDILDAVGLVRQFLGGSPQRVPEAFRTASGYQMADAANAVPALLMHGGQDPLVLHRQSVRMGEKLRELDVPNVCVSLPWATHAFDFNLHGPAGQLTTYAIEWFLEAVTRR